ncbi:twin-arginine translocation pathway signal [Nocardia nova]|uniref:Twin-arginine translocation pathway signal n=1 Tax=Nocardia nova TaxID=37330 RepID=A0A2S6AMQ5_9NOCA|nr:twin-arginine translocation pathway signal [Nocardia nova]PPJ36531.1 twin-arginine translocation pathway signal [Nocardia nova]
MSAVDIKPGKQSDTEIEIESAAETDSGTAPLRESPVSEPDSGTRPERGAWRPRTIVAALLLVTIMGVVASSILFVRTQHARDRRADTVAVEQAAREGAVSILSYQPATVDADLAKAKDLLTGDFRDYYTKFTGDVVAPASKQKKIATTATVPAVGAVTVGDGKATVLIFVNQRTTSADSPQPADSASSVRVGLVYEGGRWLINKFDPV